MRKLKAIKKNCTLALLAGALLLGGIHSDLAWATPVSGTINTDEVTVHSNGPDGNGVDYLNSGQEVSISSEQETDDGFVWYEVSYTDEEGVKTTGWVRSDMLDASEEQLEDVEAEKQAAAEKQKEEEAAAAMAAMEVDEASADAETVNTQQVEKVTAYDMDNLSKMIIGVLAIVCLIFLVLFLVFALRFRKLKKALEEESDDLYGYDSHVVEETPKKKKKSKAVEDDWNYEEPVRKKKKKSKVAEDEWDYEEPIRKEKKSQKERPIEEPKERPVRKKQEPRQLKQEPKQSQQPRPSRQPKQQTGSYRNDSPRRPDAGTQTSEKEEQAYLEKMLKDSMASGKKEKVSDPVIKDDSSDYDINLDAFEEIDETPDKLREVAVEKTEKKSSDDGDGKKDGSDWDDLEFL